MEPRIDVMNSEVGQKFVKHINMAAKSAIGASKLPENVHHLVEIRASQINGCSVCLDMHTKIAAAAGETPVRLAMIAAWREATVFTEAERAALALTEAGTRLADSTGVGDDVWDEAKKHFDDEQLAGLTVAIAIINAYNRLNAILHNPGGDFDPAQWSF